MPTCPTECVGRASLPPLPSSADFADLAAFSATVEPHEPPAPGAAAQRSAASGPRASAVFGAAVVALAGLERSCAQLSLDGTRNVWVLKPSYGSKGIGVRLLSGGVLP